MFKYSDYIYEIYKEKSFTKAAKNLFISQPALSATVRKLEEEMQVQLFDRSTTPLTLTPEGEAYIKAIEEIFSIKRDYENYIIDVSKLSVGSISVSGANFISSYVLPRIIVPFSEKFPDRFFDVGIAEEHAITFAAGLSAAGMHTVFAVYSTFLQRSYDQLIHDVSLQNLPIIIAVDRAGIALNDGPTHHGIYDVSMALSIPGSTIWAPLDFESLDRILPRAIAAKGCHFVRYRSGEAFYDTEHVLAYVDSELFLRATEDTNAGGVIITYGHITTQALMARETAKQRGISLKVIVPEKLSTDEAFINTLCHLIPPGATKICFLEEGIENGGYGMALHALSEKCRLPYEILAIKDGGISFRENESPYKTLGISHEDVLRVFGI